MSDQETESGFLGAESYAKLKTHFPSARVKKLMQSDEDIGKVSQATPLVVGRALELFMCGLVEHAANTARAQGTNRVGADTLNKAIKSEDSFDFLEGVCDKYIQ